jgi:hypothetical protein
MTVVAERSQQEPDNTPEKTIFLHIGTMKTGTSYIQGSLEQLEDRLARVGVLYPGNVGSAVHDVLDKRGAKQLGEVQGAWDELAKRVRSWPGPTAIISMEFLTLATFAQADRIVHSFGAADVRVVLTVRDLVRTIASAWQQTTKNRSTTPWAEFVQTVLDPERASDPVFELFWNHHDIPRIVRTWSDVVGMDRVCLVVVPENESSPEVLWQRFCTAVDLDPEVFPPTDGAGRANASLGLPEAEMMRRLNAELGRRVDQVDYRRLVTGFLSRRVLRRGEASRQRPELDSEHYARAVERAHELISDLKALDVRVVGSLSELMPLSDEPVGNSAPGPSPSDAEVADVAIRAVAALVTRLADAERDGPAELRRTRLRGAERGEGPSSGPNRRRRRPQRPPLEPEDPTELSDYA